MSSTTDDLISGVCLLEFVTKALKLVLSDKFACCGLLATEYCGVLRGFDIDGKCFQSVSGRAGVNERDKFTDIIAVGHDINRMDIKGRIYDE